jgi:peptidoglycan/LPS O-acetylase OafA/YrhL
VSKYPPSLSYASLELGLLALCLALFFALERARRPGPDGPLLVLGQTALFYYLLHVHVLTLAAWVLDAERAGGLATAWLAALATLVVLYPACAWYRRYKQARPDGWVRFL